VVALSAALHQGGSFDASLDGEAERALELREAADYDAASVAHDEAAATGEQAERFVEAVRRLFEP
jgi:uncharacterized protein (UPF0332 family)